MSGFNNPVVGGTKLVREAIQSPDFQTGVEGWSINQDGSAEFHDVTLTGGSLVVTSSGEGVFVYAGAPAAGNLIASIASAAGTDAHGNAYPVGFATFATDGSHITINSTSGTDEISLQPPAQTGATFDPATIDTSSAPDKSAYLLLTSPHETGSGSGVAQLQLEGSDGLDVNTHAFVLADQTEVVGDFQVDGSASVLAALAVGGLFTADNIAAGSVNITPSAANTPTGKAVSYGPLSGTNFFAFATPVTGVPGTTVTGVGVTSVTGSGMTVVLTRTNTTTTTVNWFVIGV